MPAARLGLPRSRRLHDRRIFLRAREAGRRLVVGCLIVNCLPAPGPDSLVGLVVSRKVGGAVVRNRARRLLRESFRGNQHRLADPHHVILVARPSIAARDFARVEADYLEALRRLGLLKPA